MLTILINHPIYSGWFGIPNRLFGPWAQDVGEAVEMGEDILVPVRYRNGQCAILRCGLALRANGTLREVASELRSPNEECNTAIQESTSIPEIVHCKDDLIEVAVMEGDADVHVQLFVGQKKTNGISDGVFIPSKLNGS